MIEAGKLQSNEKVKVTDGPATAMCAAMNNCSGFGTCNPDGTCACDEWHKLADCSLQTTTFLPGSKWNYSTEAKGPSWFSWTRNDQPNNTVLTITPDINLKTTIYAKAGVNANPNMFDYDLMLTSYGGRMVLDAD
jgi:hypothetical protein